MKFPLLLRSLINYQALYTRRTFLLIIVIWLVSATNSMAESGSDSLKHNDKTVIADWQPAGFVQQHFLIDNIEGKPSYFLIHRARIGISGKLNKKINFDFVVGALEPPDRKPALVNAFADFSIHPLFNLRTGQFLVPFGLEGPEVITLNPAIERAYPTLQMNNYRMFRDIGLMVQGTYSFINYSFAVLNGAGANVPENIDPKDFVFRTIFTLSPDIKAGFSAQTGKFENTEGEIRNLKNGLYIRYMILIRVS